MNIQYKDHSLTVSYIQLYLQEYFGLSVHKVYPKKTTEDPYWEMTSNDTIKVTGYHNTQTYSSVALWMAFNYPNEGFPQIYTVNDHNEWIATDYIYDPNEQPPDDYTGDTEDYALNKLINIITDNIDNSLYHRQLIQIPERVISYLLNEVVTPLSTPEEVLRIKTMMYPAVYADYNNKTPITFDKQLEQDIREIQQNFINKYTIKYEDLDGNPVNETIDTINQSNRMETVQLPKRTVFTNISVTVTDSSPSILSNIIGLIVGRGEDSKYSSYSVLPCYDESLYTYDDLILYYTTKDSNGKILEYKIENPELKYTGKLDNSYVYVSLVENGSTICNEEGFTPVQCIHNFTLLSVLDDEDSATKQNSELYNYDYSTGDFNLTLKYIVSPQTFSNGSFVNSYVFNFIGTQYLSLNSLVELPDQFKDFKVTGYVDPWTEIIIKDGYEEGDVEG